MEKKINKSRNRMFEAKLLEIFETCYENDTDNCTLTLEYDKAILEVDFTFRVKRKDDVDGNLLDNCTDFEENE